MVNKIDGINPLRALHALRKTTKASSADKAEFSKHLDSTSDVEESSAAQDASPVGHVTGVLNLQEVDDALARAAKGKLRAQDLLDKLDQLRMDILGGAINREKLLQLAKAVNARRTEVSDPKLAEILDEIDLRAQVELAKFTQTTKNS